MTDANTPKPLDLSRYDELERKMESVRLVESAITQAIPMSDIGGKWGEHALHHVPLSKDDIVAMRSLLAEVRRQREAMKACADKLEEIRDLWPGSHTYSCGEITRHVNTARRVLGEY